MKNVSFFIFLATLHCVIVSAQSDYPADISFLVSDFKYSKTQGIKICEVQHGSLSAFGGDIFTAGQDGRMCPMIADYFAQFPHYKWGAGWMYQPLKRLLSATGWKMEQSINRLVKDSRFMTCAVRYPENTALIATYAGIVYADFELIKNIYYRTKFPGILFINAVTFPYWNDKCALNALFDLDDELKQYKADWKMYEKKYDAHLAQRIQQDMPSNMYVIKPRSEVLAHGILIVPALELDSVLKIILQPAPSLQHHPDKKYGYWLKNKDDSFIVEKYYESDYLSFASPLDKATDHIQEYHYDATMRLAFMLQCDGGKMTYHCMGGFWKLPSKALEEDGTLNEKRISCCTPPFYKQIDPELLDEVNVHMEKAMLRLYRVMLDKEYC
ncbi:hypothetical protein Noda2021_11190 [Candidatus Dependentiae bacterium Noda2021]|nr:hypothetical protein Noda2021_11190 [Candidatus Dependentiae bacterium Noda2021]